jgi:hypothetical protein
LLGQTGGPTAGRGSRPARRTRTIVADLRHIAYGVGRSCVARPRAAFQQSRAEARRRSAVLRCAAARGFPPSAPSRSLPRTRRSKAHDG